jgi:hypothetical protein
MQDQYFIDKLQAPTKWQDILEPPKRCLVPSAASGGQTIQCKDLMTDPSIIMDYPTFNPLLKTKPYQFFYAISPTTLDSRW